MQASISLWLAFRWGCSYVLQEILVCAFSVYFHYLMCSALGWERQKWLFGRYSSTCKFISLSWWRNRTYYFFITQSFWLNWYKMPSKQFQAENQSVVVLLGTGRKRLEEPVFPKKIPSRKKIFVLRSNVNFDEKFSCRSAWGDCVYTYIYTCICTHKYVFFSVELG